MKKSPFSPLKNILIVLLIDILLIGAGILIDARRSENDVGGFPVVIFLMLCVCIVITLITVIVSVIRVLLNIHKQKSQ